jgi:hypothetical protein
MTHVWHFRKWLPDRKGKPCRVICRGRNGNTLVEFADGFPTSASTAADAGLAATARPSRGTRQPAS